MNKVRHFITGKIDELQEEKEKSNIGYLIINEDIIKVERDGNTFKKREGGTLGQYFEKESFTIQHNLYCKKMLQELNKGNKIVCDTQ